MVSKSAQMSTPMTSAPSSASRIACDRPWPRARPVMKATLFCRAGIVVRPNRGSAGHVDRECDGTPGEAGPEPDLLLRVEPELAQREDRLDGHLHLPPRQVGAQATVDARPEGQV